MSSSDEMREDVQLDVTEMARRLGVSEHRVRTIARHRDIGRTVGRLWFFEPSDVERMQPRDLIRPASKTASDQS